VVAQALRCAAVTPGTGLVAALYDMDAVFMSFQMHGRGIHAVCPRTFMPQAGGRARITGHADVPGAQQHQGTPGEH
jgi:hypothetical protein